MKRKVSAFLATFVVLVGLLNVATPAKAHTYTGCTNWQGIGYVQYQGRDTDGLDMWSTYWYTKDAWSTCHDVNITHATAGCIDVGCTIPTLIYACSIDPSGSAPPYFGGWQVRQSNLYHTWVIPCVGVPSWWQFRVWIKTSVAQGVPTSNITH